MRNNLMEQQFHYNCHRARNVLVEKKARYEIYKQHNVKTWLHIERERFEFLIEIFWLLSSFGCFLHQPVKVSTGLFNIL